MTSGHQYFWSKWYTSVQAMMLLHGGAANGLQIITYPHWQGSNFFKSSGWTWLEIKPTISRRRSGCLRQPLSHPIQSLTIEKEGQYEPWLYTTAVLVRAAMSVHCIGTLQQHPTPSPDLVSIGDWSPIYRRPSVHYQWSVTSPPCQSRVFKSLWCKSHS